MGPVILCDKSTVQSLHRLSPELLHHYFTINIPPILVREILGDLVKESDKDPAILVRSLARRLSSVSAIPNVDFRSLVSSELEGNLVPLCRRPILGPGRVLLAENGQLGIEVTDDPFEQAINSWRNGEFSVNERTASTLWREGKCKLNWRLSIDRLSSLYTPSLRPKRTSEEVLEFVDDLIASSPESLTAWYCGEFLIEAPHLEKVRPLESAPYTTFCIRVTLFALWAMNFKLVPSKADNQLDMEYLFYLPFAHVFATRDKFQNAIAKVFLEPSQELLDHDEFAADLSRIAAWISSLDKDRKAEELKKLGPPENDGSCCHRLWQKFMGPAYRSKQRLHLTTEQEQELVDYAMMLSSGKQMSGNHGLKETDGTDFVFRNRTIQVDDPCPCRSGEPFKDCHGKNGVPPESEI